MSKISYKQAVSDALREEMLRDDKVFIMGEDIAVYGGSYGITAGFLEEFGEQRVIDTPIAESGFTNMAVGAALCGYRPIVEYMFADFVSVCIDAIVNQAAKTHFMTGGQFSAPIVMRTPCCGGTGAAAQHSQAFEAWFAHSPGLKVILPSNPYDAKGLLKAAIRDDNPVIFYEHKLLYENEGEVPDGDYIVEIGKANVVREGTDVTLISYSLTLLQCLKAAEELAKLGISAHVLDLRTVSPLDRPAIIAAAKKTGRVLIVHEAVTYFGVGAEVASAICESDALFSLKAPVRRLGSAYMPVPFSKPIEQQALPQIDDIVREAVRLYKYC